MVIVLVTPVTSSAVTNLGGWGSAGTGDGQFNRPLGVATCCDGARVYVTDKLNNRIQEFTDRGTFVRSFGPGATSAITNPWAIAVVPKINGDVYVSSARSGGIYQYTADGAFIRTWRPLSSSGGDSTPSGLAVSPVSGDVYLATVRRLEVFTAQGTFLSDFPLAVVNNTKSAVGVAVAQNGDVYVNGYENVQVYTSTGQLIRSWGISGSNPGQLTYARGIALGSLGDIYVLDRGRYSGRVQQFTPDGRLLQSWADDVSLTDPAGIASTGNGVVLVANTYHDRIESYRP